MLLTATNLSDLFGDDDDDDDDNEEDRVVPEQGNIPSIVSVVTYTYFNQSDSQALQDLFGDDVGLSSSE